jgi:putative ATP-dependent endonuclease of OLD family
MHIKEIKIENFKSFNGIFKLQLSDGLNILVGDNEAGKSTILEAIHLALSGFLNGRYIRNELSQYLFNNQTVKVYLDAMQAGENAELPKISIELFLDGEGLANFEGDDNSYNRKDCCLCFAIAFQEKYKPEYEVLVQKGEIKSLPIEYYDVSWSSCARENGITPRSIPLKSALVDASSTRTNNGSDVYISRIIRDNLEPEEKIAVSQAHRMMKEQFMEDEAIKLINEKIGATANISNKDVKLAIDLSTKNSWENTVTTYLDNVPFHHIGKGEQCLVKTKLALSHRKAKEASILLLEEPENHLSHTKLNSLIKEIKHSIEGENKKQIIISTHSSFVANKLGLDNLILLHDQSTVRLTDLASDTPDFFNKLAGYDTLRLILCEKAILVEGDSDELIVQRAYMDANGGKLPIENGVDVISVGTSFLRFLEVAEKVGKEVAVLTDSDGNIEALEKKYENYLGTKKMENISICYDLHIDSGSLMIGDKPFNYNTLEPKLMKENSLETLNSIFNKGFTSEDELHKYMRNNKTECALKIFESTTAVKFPQYILDAI